MGSPSWLRTLASHAHAHVMPVPAGVRRGRRHAARRMQGPSGASEACRIRWKVHEADTGMAGAGRAHHDHRAVVSLMKSMTPWPLQASNHNSNMDQPGSQQLQLGRAQQGDGRVLEAAERREGW